MYGEKAVKAVMLLAVIAIGGESISLWYETVILGNYFASAGIFLSVLAAAAPVGILVGAFYLTRFILKLKFSDL